MLRFSRNFKQFIFFAMLSIIIISLSECKKEKNELPVKESLKKCYYKLKSELCQDVFKTINWQKGDCNEFINNKGESYNIYIIATTKKESYIIYADYNGHEVIRVVDLSNISGIKTFNGNVLIYNSDGKVIKELRLTNGHLINDNKLRNNRNNEYSVAPVSEGSEETLPEVVVTGFTTLSPSSFDFWNMYYFLMDNFYYNDFISFQIINSTSGGGSVVAPQLQTNFVKDPCEALKALTAQTEFVVKMQDLATKTDLNHEEGYVITRNSLGELAYAHVVGSDNKPDISFNFNTSTLGLIHSHKKGLNSMPSSTDLVQLGYLFASFQPSVQRIQLSGEFTLGVVSTYGSYLFKIENAEKFVTFFYKVLKNPIKIKQFDYEYQNKYFLANENMSADWENNFLQLLSDYNVGLKMYNGSFGNTKWQEKILNNFNNSAHDGPCKNFSISSVE